MLCVGVSLPGATALILAATLWLVLGRASRRKLHPCEPPVVVPPWIPVFGHLLGMAWQGGRYMKSLGYESPNPALLIPIPLPTHIKTFAGPGYSFIVSSFPCFHRGLSHSTNTSQKYPRLARLQEPILTLPVPGSRIYLVTDPHLAAVIQRNSKSLSFTPLIPDIIKRVLGLDDGTVRIVRSNLDPGPGDPRGLIADMHDVVYGALGPGRYLDTLSCEASQELCLRLRELQADLRRQPSSGDRADLLAVIRHMVATGTARYLYGEANPLSENPELEESFWHFDEGVGGLLAGILPSITASRAYRGREKMVAAFVDYLENSHDAGASQLIRDRIRVEREWGMSVEAVSRSALSFLFAGIVNTSTTTFWIVLRLFADHELLGRVRGEIKTALAASEEQCGPDMLSINIVRNTCPVLSAVLRECLRIGSENFSVRLVKEDMMLADKYFLKKGGVVQISSGVIHSDRSVWGDDVDRFNPSRFLGGKPGSAGFHPAAFRGFGGGKTICPGRHFAINEILLFSAMIVLSFDIESPDGGTVRVPPKNDQVMPVHILEPSFVDRPQVNIRPRDEAGLLSRLTITT